MSSPQRDGPIVLGEQILATIRLSGLSKMEAFSALKIASAVLTCAPDISLSNDAEPEPTVSASESVAP